MRMASLLQTFVQAQAGPEISQGSLRSECLDVNLLLILRVRRCKVSAHASSWTRSIVILAGTAALLLFVSLPSVRAAGSAAPSSIPSDTVFAGTQAARGRVLYAGNCGTCHGGSLQGSGTSVPPLIGPPFLEKWGARERTLQDLFSVLSTTMPKDDPGALTKSQYADILAYVLSRNGHVAGERDLLPSEAVLRTLRLSPPLIP
jgi:mono/diheme cytochrome c family protein